MPPDYAIDINDIFFYFYSYCRKHFLPKKIWKKSLQDEPIPFNKDLHQKDLHNHPPIWSDLHSKHVIESQISS